MCDVFVIYMNVYTYVCISEEIHHLDEVRHIATAVGQRKQGAWTKWESENNRTVIWGDLKHIEPKN